MSVDFPTPPLPLATPIYLTSLAKIEVDNLLSWYSALIPVKPNSNFSNLAKSLVTVFLKNVFPFIYLYTFFQN